MRGLRGLRGSYLGVACLLVAAALPPAAFAAQEGQASAPIELVGKTDLGGAGLNGDVAVAGKVAIVGAGIVAHTGWHTERYNPAPCFEATAKVVDLSNPKRPKVAATIPLPPGVAAIDVDALEVETPEFFGTLAAIALDDAPSHQGPNTCAPNSRNPQFTDRGVLYYDITKPDAPRLLGRYLADQGPQDDVPENALPCGPPPAGGPIKCATGLHSVSLVQREDGRVLSIAVEPVADLLVKPSGDVRLVDVTNPAEPRQLSAWPPLGERPSSSSTNGCSTFANGHSATFYDGGRRALVAFNDAGLFDLNVGTAGLPAMASQFAYPGDGAEEGNAGYASAALVDGVTIAALSEEGWFPSQTTLTIDAPAPLAGAKPACESLPTLFDQTNQGQLAKKPEGKVSGQIVYGGRGCPARGTNNPAPEDAYPADPRGRIVLIDIQRITATQPALPNQGCNVATRLNRAAAAGALAVVMGRVDLAPFSASRQQMAWGTEPPSNVPTVLVDPADANALRTALCPGLNDDGQCNPGVAVTGSVGAAPGAWGGLRVLEVDPDTGMRQLALIHSPRGTVFPPPDLGVYAPGRSVTVGPLAYVAWHADGLRVLDLSQAPVAEVGHYVPPDTPDPSGTLPAKASVVGVAVAGGHIVITDQNSGLYVLSNKGLAPGGGGGKLGLFLGIGLGLMFVAGAAAFVVGRRRY